MRLAGAGLLPPMLSAVLVTHLHSDHLTDLNDVITMHWVMSPQPATLSVFGPPGMREVVDATLGALAPDIRYRLAHHADLTEPPSVEVTEVTPGGFFEVGAIAVRVAATDHRPVEPAVAYRLESDGRSAVLGGDGVPCAGLDALCKGADAYVQTVIREDLVRQVPNARFQDIVDYHSTVEDAARTAARTGVGTLVSCATRRAPSSPPAGSTLSVHDARRPRTGGATHGRSRRGRSRRAARRPDAVPGVHAGRPRGACRWGGVRVHRSRGQGRRRCHLARTVGRRVSARRRLASPHPARPGGLGGRVA